MGDAWSEVQQRLPVVVVVVDSLSKGSVSRTAWLSVYSGIRAGRCDVSSCLTRPRVCMPLCAHKNGAYLQSINHLVHERLGCR